MVFLKDLQEQWPWCPENEDFSDKEIYTHFVEEEDASDLWRIPIYDPMRGFAYTGVRVCTFEKDSYYTVVPKIVLGATKKPMFGLPWDQTVASNGSWAPLGFPLTNKMIAITEDGLDLLIQHPLPCWGKVEFVAQRFEDLLEDESEIAYIFLHHRTDKVEWILNPDNLMYKPRSHSMPVYNQKSKVIPSILRLLDKNRMTWLDTSVWWNEVRIPAPLLDQNLIANNGTIQV